LVLKLPNKQPPLVHRLFHEADRLLADLPNVLAWPVLWVLQVFLALATFFKVMSLVLQQAQLVVLRVAAQVPLWPV
jgi:hypothetical protein